PDVSRFIRNLVSHMLRTDPEERPQDLGVFAERIRACLQKAERRTAFTRSFAPAAIPGTQEVEKKRGGPALALAAAIVVLAAFGAFFLPERLANREHKPLGVLIGVPERTPEASLISESSAAPVALPQAGEQSPMVAQQSPIPAPTPIATGTTDKLVTSPQLAVNNRMAEPPPPAEGPGQTSQPLVATEARPPAEKSEPSPSAVPDSSGTLATDSSSTPAEKAK